MEAIASPKANSSTDRPEGISKFIALMRNLSQYSFPLFMLISEDPNHQQTIYECLNSQQLNSLFDSIHEEDSQLRITAIRFVCLLLHGNARMVELMGLLEGCESSSGHRKYILGGLEYYKLSPNQMRQLVGALGKLRLAPGVLAWSIDLKTFKISYCSINQQFPFDPNRTLVGIFVRRQAEEDKSQRSRYKIGKK